MRTTHSFSIEFLKRSCRGKKKKGKAHIYARIWVDGEAAEISLKEEIKESDWDAHAEQVKGRSIQVKSLNDHIIDVRDKIRNKYRILQQAEALITAESVKQEYLGIQSQLTM